MIQVRVLGCQVRALELPGQGSRAARFCTDWSLEITRSLEVGPLGLMGG